ncbi:uncharacterized protein LOC135808251 [Sycon ciliatum]|uniref:uncharacterized protein LOC135808251 n=1 Tax=Sycon ciliatum TaxID=27933 RepID=UPI0031F6DBEC
MSEQWSMESRYSRALQDLRVDFLRDLKCEDFVLEHLHQQRVLGTKQRDAVRGLQYREEQARQFLKEVDSICEARAWSELLYGLRKSSSTTHHFLADSLELKASGRSELIQRPLSAPAKGYLDEIMKNPDEEECSSYSPAPASRQLSHPVSSHTPGLSAGGGDTSSPRLPPIRSQALPQHSGSQPSMSMNDPMRMSASSPGSGPSLPSRMHGVAQGHHLQHQQRHQHQLQPSQSSAQPPSRLGDRSQFPQQPATSHYHQWQSQHSVGAGRSTPAAAESFLPPVTLPQQAAPPIATGIDFESLSDRELENLAEMLYGSIGIEFPKLVNSLLCSIAKYRHGAQMALISYQRATGYQGDLFALLKLWIAESDEPCTGLSLYRALHEIAPGIAVQCKGLLKLP